MDGSTELIKLAHLLNVGADAARDIGRLRPRDAARIAQLARQADAVAAELRAVATLPRARRTLRSAAPSPPRD